MDRTPTLRIGNVVRFSNAEFDVTVTITHGRCIDTNDRRDDRGAEINDENLIRGICADTGVALVVRPWLADYELVTPLAERCVCLGQ